MRRACAALLLALSMSVGLPLAASAHPLGNFTINRYTGIVLAGNRVRLHYVLDMAEIPAFQEKQTITDQEAYATAKSAELGRNLEVQVDGARQTLAVERHVLSYPDGQGGLTLLRLEVVFAAPDLRPGSHQVSYADHNYDGRLGWKEITLQTSGGARVSDTSLGSKSVSDELRAYPQDRLSSPLNVTSAAFAATPGEGAGALPNLLNRQPGGQGIVKDLYIALVSVRDLTPLALLLSLGAAIALGAAHALSPGHGKAVMAAYLVGNRKDSRHAVILGVTITTSHTIAVFALGLVTLFLSTVISPFVLFQYVGVGSGLLLVLLGVTLLVGRTRLALRTSAGPGPDRHDHAPHDHDHAPHDHDHDDHDHEHDHHDHEHDHHGPVGTGEAHSHGFGSHVHEVPAVNSGLRGLVTMGISAGLLPCPSALLVLLSAFALHRVAYGIVLVLAFSVGLAGTLTGIGVVLARGLPIVGRLPARSRRLGSLLRLTRFASAGAALVITVAGVGVTYTALHPA